MTLLLTLLLKSLLVCALAGATLFALRRASAAARHLVCLLTLAALLALPLFSLTLPGWRLPVMESQVSEPMPPEPTPSRLGSPPLSVSEGPGISVGAGPIADGVPHSASSLTGSTRAKQGGGFQMQEDGFLVLYALGVLLAALRPLLGLWGIARLRRLCADAGDAPALTAAADCAARLHLPAPRLCRADVCVPMTWGWRRPVVLLPAASAGWPEGRLRAVLLHEMAHVKRRDWPGHRLADFACAVYWFHPLVWLTARRLRAESELACDDLVLASGIPAPDYARHLLDVAQALPPASRPPHSAIAMAHTSRVEGRITMILDETQNRRAVTRRALLVALVPASAALVSLAVLRLDAKAQAAPVLVAARHSRLLAVLPVTPAAMPRKLSVGIRLRPAPVKLKPRVAAQAAPPKAILSAAPPPPVAAPVPPSAVSAATPPAILAASTPSKDTGPSDPSQQLAGVTDADKPGGSWWSATGVPLPTPVYDTAANRAVSHAFGGGTENVILAFRLPGSTTGTTAAYRLPDAVGSSSEGSWPFKLQAQEHLTEAQFDAQSGGARVLTAAFPASLSKTNIQLGLAAGSWTVAARCGSGALHQGGTIGVRQGGSSFLFSPASETTSGSVISIATDAADDLRVVAVNAQGQELLPAQIGDNSIGALDQITATFGLPLAQIKEIRVETRPFHWTEFKDVALKPRY